jgi:protein-L-isoaspartate(D-aspartate) O-methyltransferase
MTDFEGQRKRMVETQLVPRGIDDLLVLKAMRKVLRELFVPRNMRDSAYSDNALPISHGQTISQPYIVALMTQALELKGGEKVLEIGTGSGYQAAVLAEIAVDVYSIDQLQLS